MNYTTDELIRMADSEIAQELAKRIEIEQHKCDKFVEDISSVCNSRGSAIAKVKRIRSFVDGY